MSRCPHGRFDPSRPKCIFCCDTSLLFELRRAASIPVGAICAVTAADFERLHAAGLVDRIEGPFATVYYINDRGRALLGISE